MFNIPNPYMLGMKVVGIVAVMAGLLYTADQVFREPLREEIRDKDKTIIDMGNNLNTYLEMIHSDLESDIKDIYEINITTPSTKRTLTRG